MMSAAILLFAIALPQSPSAAADEAKARGDLGHAARHLDELLLRSAVWNEVLARLIDATNLAAPTRNPFAGNEEAAQRYCWSYQMGFMQGLLGIHYPSMMDDGSSTARGWYDGHRAGFDCFEGIRRDFEEGNTHSSSEKHRHE